MNVGPLGCTKVFWYEIKRHLVRLYVHRIETTVYCQLPAGLVLRYGAMCFEHPPFLNFPCAIFTDSECCREGGYRHNFPWLMFNKFLIEGNMHTLIFHQHYIHYVRYTLLTNLYFHGCNMIRESTVRKYCEVTMTTVIVQNHQSECSVVVEIHTM